MTRKESVVAQCKSCKAEIRWETLVSGKKIPLDPEPHPEGNVVIMPAGAMVMPKETAALGKEIGAKRYRPHLCPGAPGVGGD